MKGLSTYALTKSKVLAIQLMPKGFIIKVPFSGYVTDGIKCSVFILNYVSIRPVIALLNSSSPSNVIRFVISIIIHSIQLVICGWRETYILKEIIKRFYPSIAYSNAPTSIPIVGRAPFVVAAAFHVAPSGVFFRLVKHYFWLFVNLIKVTRISQEENRFGIKFTVLIGALLYYF
jgi:hypothetical protein